jgi:multimeric flavodoxin WrbA
VLNRVFYAAAGIFYRKPGAAIVSARRAGTTAAIDVLNKYMTIANMPVVSSQYWNMVHGNTPDEVRQDAEGMHVMRILGKNMAWMLKSIHTAKANGVDAPPSEQKTMTNFIR